MAEPKNHYDTYTGESVTKNEANRRKRDRKRVYGNENPNYNGQGENSTVTDTYDGLQSRPDQVQNTKVMAARMRERDGVGQSNYSRGREHDEQQGAFSGGQYTENEVTVTAKRNKRETSKERAERDKAQGWRISSDGTDYQSQRIPVKTAGVEDNRKKFELTDRDKKKLNRKGRRDERNKENWDMETHHAQRFLKRKMDKFEKGKYNN